jgi:hypothetical protein
MTTQSNPKSQDSAEKIALSTGIARRRLLRAGLAAAPVVAALKSNSVLAGDHTCIKPSSFSSLKPANWNLSKGRSVNTNYACHSHGYWKNTKEHPHPSPYTDLTKSFFQAVPAGAPNGSQSAGFSGTRFIGKTLINVLEMTGGDRIALARHLVATFLTAVANADNPNLVLLTTSQCKTIWTGNGVWSPAPGLNWTLDDTMAYFNKIYGPEFAITSN